RVRGVLVTAVDLCIPGDVGQRFAGGFAAGTGQADAEISAEGGRYEPAFRVLNGAREHRNAACVALSIGILGRDFDRNIACRVDLRSAGDIGLRVAIEQIDANRTADAGGPAYRQRATIGIELEVGISDHRRAAIGNDVGMVQIGLGYRVDAVDRDGTREAHRLAATETDAGRADGVIRRGNNANGTAVRFDLGVGQVSRNFIVDQAVGPGATHASRLGRDREAAADCEDRRVVIGRNCDTCLALNAVVQLARHISRVGTLDRVEGNREVRGKAAGAGPCRYRDGPD